MATQPPVPDAMQAPFLARLALRAAGLARRLAAAADARPIAFGLIILAFTFALVVVEVSYWPLHDYPGAPWHLSDPGIEVRITFARAPFVGWDELLGFWTGPILLGNKYFQPLTSWLFVAEYHAFGTVHQRWLALGLLFHLLVTGTLFAIASRFAPGPRPARLLLAGLTALLFAGPGFADRMVHRWILGWWPAQPDMLSLLFGLLLLLAVAEYARSPRPALLAAGTAAFCVGVFFKETAYVAGVGACLLLVRHRRHWSALALFAAVGLLLFGYRCWALDNATAFGTAHNAMRPFHIVAMWASFGFTLLPHMLHHLGLLALAAAAVRRARLHRVASLVSILTLYLASASLVIGPPWDFMFLLGFRPLVSSIFLLFSIWALVRSLHRWPAIELLGIYLLCEFLALSFPQSLQWHRYWPLAFEALLVTTVVLPQAWAIISKWAGGSLKEYQVPRGNELLGDDHA